MKAVNAAYETLTGASHDDLQGKESAEDLLTLSATVTFMTGGGPARPQAATFWLTMAWSCRSSTRACGC